MSVKRYSTFRNSILRCYSFCFFCGLPLILSAQGIRSLFEKGSFSAQVQADMQYCLKDSANDTSGDVNRFLSHLYIDGAYNSRMLNAGVRFELYENPLPGFEPAYKGYGIPYFYLTLNIGKFSVTGGDFYEQFGSGLILRTYQERLLGIDNALRGGRIIYTPFSWMRFKAVAGFQRSYWQWSRSRILGANLELDIEQWFPALHEHNRHLLVEGSFVTKHEKEEFIITMPGKRLNLPMDVGAFSTRLKYQTNLFTFQGEYAWKANDPSAENHFIYRPGQALLLTAGYSRKGLGITLGAKHCDNMSFHSERTITGNALQLNYLPAFARQHTYALATLYPYATQVNGEVAFQADVFYKFGKGTVLGGKYGMDIKLNYSHVYSLKKQYEPGQDKSQEGTYGYTTSLFAIGNETYYRDINIELARRMNKDLKLTLMYMNQQYNDIVRGKNGMIYSHIGVAEVLWRLKSQVTFRGEIQYLTTRQDLKDWAAALAELSVTSHWMFTVTDLYNINGSHYPLGSVAYTIGAHRLQLSAGRQREGYNCAGGICRYVPATKGFALSYTANF